jgi:hypothetical protein
VHSLTARSVASVGKLAPPVPAGHFLRRHNVTCVMLLQEQQELIRPAQRAVDPELVGVRCGVGNGGIVNVEHQGLNGGTSVGPAQDCHRSLGGLSRQVDTYRDHSRSVSRKPQSWRAAGHARMEQLMDFVIARLQRSLLAASEDSLNQGMHFPSRLGPVHSTTTRPCARSTTTRPSTTTTTYANSL